MTTDAMPSTWGRNLSRQPEQDSALGFLARAHEVRRGATAALQVGLQLGEQREVDGLQPTTLAQGREQLRARDGVRAVAERLAGWAEEQQHVVDKLAGIAPAAQAMVAKAVERLRPVIEAAVQRVWERPERVVARERAAEVEVMRREARVAKAREIEQVRREPRAGPSMGR